MKYIFTILIAFFAISLTAQIFTNYTEADGLISNSVSSVVVDADDNLWFGTNKGISRFDGTTWTNYNMDNSGLVDNVITAIFIDRDGVLWAGTDFGVSTMEGNTWRTYTVDDGLADNRVTGIDQGDEGIIWISNKDGVTLKEPNAWASLVMADGVPFGGVTSVSFDSENSKYFSTPLSGVIKFNGVDLIDIIEADGLLSDKVRAVAIDSDDNKWVGTSDGISVFDRRDNFVTNHKFVFTLPPPDSINPVEDIQIDSEGRIWAGIYIDYLVTEGGVSMFDGNSWVDFDEEDGLVGPVVRQLAIDSNDDVWVATSTGVTQISLTPSSTKDLLAANFEVFPNPVSDQLNIKLKSQFSNQNRLVKVFNTIGKLVDTSVIAKGEIQTSIEMGQHASGLYFVEVSGQVVKVIVE